MVGSGTLINKRNMKKLAYTIKFKLGTSLVLLAMDPKEAVIIAQNHNLEKGLDYEVESIRDNHGNIYVIKSDLIIEKA